MINNEYWITEDGIQPVEPEGGHELIATQRAASDLLQLLDVEAPDEFIERRDIVQAFARYLRESDLVPLDNSDEWVDQVVAVHPKGEEIKKLAEVSEGYAFLDPRDYAMRHWRWIRISGCDVTIWTLPPEAARSLRDKILDLLIDFEGYEDEAEAGAVEINLNIGTGRSLRLTVDELGDPTTWTAASTNPLHEAAAAIATAQIRALDVATMPACYGGVIGD